MGDSPLVLVVGPSGQTGSVIVNALLESGNYVRIGPDTESPLIPCLFFFSALQASPVLRQTLVLMWTPSLRGGSQSTQSTGSSAPRRLS